MIKNDNLKNSECLLKTEDKLDNSVFSENTKIRAVNFIMKKEGYRENAYRDAKGVWTIGFGHIKGVKPGDKITKKQAEKFLEEDFIYHIAPLKYVIVPLSNNQKIALSSFIFNVGANAFKKSTLLKKLNAGDILGAANEFDKWVYTGKKINKGLMNRRRCEKALFLTPDK